MATITKRKGKRGISYQAKIRISGHPPISETFDRIGEAYTWAEDTEKALRSGGYVGPAPPGDMPFEEALDKYIEYIETATKRVGKENVPLKKINTTLREATASIRLHKDFDRYTLKQITPMLCAAYRDKRLKEVSVSTFLKEVFVFGNVYKMARTDWGLLDLTNPFQDVQKPSQEEGRLRFLTVEEAVSLYEAAQKSKNKKFNIYILLMLQSGMRPSEAAGLTWEKINLEERYIDLTVTKTKPRYVPLSIPARDLLKEMRPKSPSDDEYVFLPATVSAYVKRQPYRYFRRAFEYAIDRAKISDFTQHDMRHTAASHLLMTEKVDLITLSNILGHSSLDMTRRYAHMLMEHKLKAIDRISHLGLEKLT